MTEDWPITPNAVGGLPALIYGHLELLHGAGCEITLLILSSERNTLGFQRFTQDQPDVWAEVQSWCMDYQQIPLGLVSRPWNALPHIFLSRSAAYFSPVAPDRQTAAHLRDVVKNAVPHLIWAEHLRPATIVACLFSQIPMVYSHADWSWRIKRYRSGALAQTWQGQLKFWLRRHQEENLVRRVDACVSASVSEAGEIRALGARQVAYFPTTYRPVNLVGDSPGESLPRIVHLGGMQTTANRLGLERFLDVTWPLLCHSLSTPPELWIVGSLEGAPATLLEKLRQVNAVCPGYVEDLATVLRPYDLHIIPWEHNTGTRTRIPLALNYGQVVVATRNGAACLAELRHGENSVLVNDLVEMAAEIKSLLFDKGRRYRLSQAGQQLFMSHFTREAVQPRFNAFIESFT